MPYLRGKDDWQEELKMIDTNGSGDLSHDALAEILGYEYEVVEVHEVDDYTPIDSDERPRDILFVDCEITFQGASSPERVCAYLSRGPKVGENERVYEYIDVEFITPGERRSPPEPRRGMF